MMLRILMHRLDEDTANHVLRILAATVMQAATRRLLSRRRMSREQLGRTFHYGSGCYYTWEVYFRKVERGELLL